MSIIELATIPKELSSIQSFIQRFNELNRYNPVIAYWCLYWGTQVGLSSSTGLTNACRDFLLRLVERLEELRKELGENENVNDEESAKAYVNSFAMEVLLQAEEKSKLSMPDVLAYLAAKDFFEILKVWGPLDEQAQKYIKFCKLRAVGISKTKSSTQKEPTNLEKDEEILKRDEGKQMESSSTFLPKPTPARQTSGRLAKHETDVSPGKETGVKPSSSHLDETSGLSSTMTGRPPSIAPLEQEALQNDSANSKDAIESFDLPRLQNSLSKLTPTRFDEDVIPSEPTTRRSFHGHEEQRTKVSPPVDTELQKKMSDIQKESADTDHSEVFDEATTAVSGSPVFPISQMTPRSSMASSTLPGTASGTPAARFGFSGFDHLDRVEAARGHARYAYSALDYDDTATAIFHLKSALGLLEQ
ncbi:endosomal sorting protein [Schizosaccharomyces cryophilus OY26]|uniref:Endosomal sorting protein n=1 Tax=Schizosaccharomyces cryophilus (strain OY26 / ATCC MYA-4695 / CBS 11777 / NBRC 106824 / NRRL Y48691) TaxID=653667 RepID=S9W121_SCHCR|nr:endosomal sorting protein [Schizosaccharomyces cryophilus OY26]EPY51765.1 endosomal sorting protein [Schizosaccharomyces cryophilus OY26]